jgi:hypothetical protein
MSPRCFIAMPITTPADRVEDYGGDEDHFAHVLECLLVPAVKLAGYEPWRPTIGATHVIHHEVVNALCVAELVLVDISGHNPNVLFELGLRTAQDRPVALVRDEQTDLPFDIAILNCHRYNSTLLAWSIDVEIEKLAGHLVMTAAHAHNPFWQQFGAARTYRRRVEEAPAVPKQRHGRAPYPTQMPLLASA